MLPSWLLSGIVTGMKLRIVFIHGNDTEHWSFAWAGWLKKELDAQGYDTFFETMPDSILARGEYWLPFLEDHANVDENTLLVGWSSGAVAAMRFAQTHKIKGSVLVSPCYTDLGDETEKASGYFNDEWHWQDIAANQERIALFCSDNDPYIPQEEFAFIAEKLQPEMHKIEGAGHFIDQTSFPEVLEYITAHYPNN